MKFMLAGVGMGLLLGIVERKLKVKSGLLILAYLAGFLVGCLFGS